MKKQSKNSPITGIRLTKDDELELKFVQDKLKAPGLNVTKAEALRRSLYAFANLLRSQENDRRQNESLKSSDN